MSPNAPEAPGAAMPAAFAGAEAEAVKKRRVAAGLAEGDPPRDAVGLALSGGGIRSATFSVGVVQGLAKAGLLKRIDYLSTVSGGGYSGSFLGRLYTRHAEQRPGDAAAAVERTLANPAAPEIQWLRESGRYLSPAGATDARLALAVVLRNWLSLMWVVASFLFALFTLVAVIRYGLWHSSSTWREFEGWLAAGAGDPIWWSPLTVVAAVPFLIGVVPTGWGYWFTQRGRSLASQMPFVITLLVIAGATLISSNWSSISKGADGSEIDEGWRRLALGVGATGLLAIVFYWLAKKSKDEPELRISAARNRLSRWLSLALLATGATLAAGVIDSLGQTIYALLVTPAVLPSGDRVLSMAAFSSMVAALAPLVAGGRVLVQWITQSGGKKKRVSLPRSLVAGLAAGLVVLILLVSLAVGSHWTFWAGGVPPQDPGLAFAKAHFDPVPAVDVSKEQLIKVDRPGVVHEERTADTPPQRHEPMHAVLWACGISLLLSAMSGRTFAFLNLSSHQSFYGARLTRAYLGASNPARHGPTGKRVTEAIAGDDLPFSDYVPHESGGPLHLLNVTLNETIGGGSEVLDRDRKGLPMALGPLGLSVGVRHHALWRRNRRPGSGGENR